MSVSRYAYVGPIIRIKNEISIDSISAICSNAQCVNHKQDNSIAGGDAFCSKCGSRVESHTFSKSIGKDFHEILPTMKSLRTIFSIFSIFCLMLRILRYSVEEKIMFSLEVLLTLIFLLSMRNLQRL